MGLIARTYQDDKLLPLDTITSLPVTRTVYPGRTLKKSLLGRLTLMPQLFIRLIVTGTIASAADDVPPDLLPLVLDRLSYKPKFFGPGPLIPENTRGIDYHAYTMPIRAGQQYEDGESLTGITAPQSGSHAFTREIWYAIRFSHHCMANPLASAYPVCTADDNDGLILTFADADVYGSHTAITSIVTEFYPEYGLIDRAKIQLPYIFRGPFEYLTTATDKQALLGPFTTPSSDLVDVILCNQATAAFVLAGGVKACEVSNILKIEAGLDQPPLKPDPLVRRFFRAMGKTNARLGLLPIMQWPRLSTYDPPFNSAINPEGAYATDDLIGIPLMYVENPGQWEPRATTLARNTGLVYTFQESTVKAKRLLYHTMDRYDAAKEAELKALVAKLGPNP